MNDAHIEAGFENTIAEQLAERIWRDHRNGLNPVIFPTCHLLAHWMVVQMLCVGIDETTIRRMVEPA
jgi:hypothetical protein